MWIFPIYQKRLNFLKAFAKWCDLILKENYVEETFATFTIKMSLKNIFS